MARIQTTVETEAFTVAGGGTVRTQQVLSEYERFLETKLAEMSGVLPVRKSGPLKVVIDCGNGCYSRIAPEVFRQQGYDVVELFCEEDGRFPHRNPNPAIAEHLTTLCQTVAQVQADFGIAFDGDGDRVVFVDHTGAMIENDKMIALFIGYLLQKHPQTKVVFDIKCSGLVRDQITLHGGQPLMEKSGHAYIKTRLFKEQAIFGGEISGHFFFQAIHGDDGLFAALLLSRLLQETGRSLHALAADFPQYLITPDIRIPYHENDAPELLDLLASSLEQVEGCEVSRLDGVRAEFASGWGLVRSSVTEPLLTFRFEADSPQHLEQVKNRFLAPVPRLKALVDDVWK
jgi:phosphomannomutase/phosphoglucomutase